MKDEKKLFLFDIDGTLIDWRKNINQLSNKMITILKRLQEDDCYVMIASGRLVPLITKVTKSFNFDGYILSDGAHTILNGDEIISEALDFNAVNGVIALANNLSLEYALLYKNGAYVKPNGIVAPFLEAANFEMNKIEYEINYQETFKIYLHCTKEKQKLVVPLLNNFNLAFEDDHELIEIRNKNCSKASGLKKILEKIDVKIDNTYFFGDGFNDIEIFKMVGHPYVMKNANVELYQYGEVCNCVENDGVYLKIREILNEGRL